MRECRRRRQVQHREQEVEVRRRRRLGMRGERFEREVRRSVQFSVLCNMSDSRAHNCIIRFRRSAHSGINDSPQMVRRKVGSTRSIM